MKKIKYYHMGSAPELWVDGKHIAIDLRPVALLASTPRQHRIQELIFQY